MDIEASFASVRPTILNANGLDVYNSWATNMSGEYSKKLSSRKDHFSDIPDS